MNSVNKKEIFFGIVIFVLALFVIFDLSYYSHNEGIIKINTTSTSVDNVPVTNPFFISNRSESNIPETNLIKTIINKVTESVSINKPVVKKDEVVATSSVIATSSTSTSTTTLAKSILPPESPIDYKDNGNGTITDNYTKLMWAKCTQGNTGKDCLSGNQSIKDYPESREDCNNLKLASKTGWRLPTLKELESIISTGFFSPAINKTFFPNTSSDPYWTITSPSQYFVSKFVVSFLDGNVYIKEDGNTAKTRCVRDNI